MSKLMRTTLVKRDGTVVQEANDQTVENVLDGVRRLLERADFKEMYLFRRNPQAPDGGINVHLYVKVNDDE